MLRHEKVGIRKPGPGKRKMWILSNSFLEMANGRSKHAISVLHLRELAALEKSLIGFGTFGHVRDQPQLIDMQHEFQLFDYFARNRILQVENIRNVAFIGL